jgi:ribosomal protein S12 methylthiotransferase
MPAQVPEPVKQQRLEELMLAQQRIAFEANEALVGSSATVLVDGIDPEGRRVGRTARQAPEVDSLCFLTEPRQPGRLVECEVVGWEDYDLIVQPEPGDE